MAENRTFPEDGTADVEDLILDLPADQARAVADVLAIVSGQVHAAWDAAANDYGGSRWSGLHDAVRIVGNAAAFARGVAR